MQIVNNRPNKDTDTQGREEWTIAKFKDEFYLCLSKVPDVNLFYLDRKYYGLAKQLTL